MNIVNCPICLSVFKNPLITKCGHSFCESCLTDYLVKFNKCPVCSLEIEPGFLIPNLMLQSLQEEVSSHRLRETKPKNKLNEEGKREIYFEFFDLLSRDREGKFENLKWELERIKELRNELGINKDSTSIVGSKRKVNFDVEEKIQKLNENFESLSATFNSKIDWESFEKRLLSSAKTFSFKELGSFRNSDPLDTSSQIISSIEVDRSGRIFATAGVLKQIKLYKFDTTLAAKTRRNYPILDISCDSKISCLSWNPFYEERLCSADYEGVVNLYDTTKGSVINSWTEHEKRCWTVDTSSLDPQRIISGSDDCKVKLWTQKYQKSLLTIDIKSNVCSVRFSPNDSNLFAVGGADHRIFLFDLRKPSVPILNQKKHSKAVSYVRFSGSDQIISASTDSTIRITKISSPTEDQVILKGHLNEKNFVGLSVNNSDGLIATGSENNSVYLYDQNLSKSVLKCPMLTECPITGVLMDDEQSTFVSSVTWINQVDEEGNNVLIAANSTGNIKIFSIIEE